MKKTADAVVIGGGIAGASTLLLPGSRMGLRNTVLLEKGDLASGSTGDSAAMVRQHYSNEVSIRLVQGEPPVLPGVPRRIRRIRRLQCLPWHRVAVPLRAGRPPGVLPTTWPSCSAWECGPGRYRLRTPPRSCPASTPNGIGPVAFEPDSGYADPNATVRGPCPEGRGPGRRGPHTYGRDRPGRSRKAAYRPWPRPPGQSPRPSSSTLRGRGPRQLGRWAGLDLPLELSREQDVAIRLPGSMPPLRRVVSNMVDRIYFRPESDRHAACRRGPPQGERACRP